MRDRTKGATNTAKKFVPEWIVRYRGEWLIPDLIAGLVVTIIVIPQSLAYALLAGLPPQFGLYASIFPVLVYAVVGSSTTQAVGPVAITSIMTYSVLAPLAPAGTPDYGNLAAALSLLSGIIVLAFGVLRLGFLSHLLSRPVISGFISGSAVLIIVSQLKFILGIRIEGATTWDVLRELARTAPEANPHTIVTGSLALAVLLCTKAWMRKWLRLYGVSHSWALSLSRLSPVAVVVIATVLVAKLDLDHRFHVAVVGSIQSGLASFSFTVPGIGTLRQLTIPAGILALIGMVQNITMAQALAIKRRERFDANKELVGLGFANIVAGVYGGMPVGGGLSRSAINVAAGAQSPLASIVSAGAMLGVVFFGLGWMERLPLAVLAANIVAAALGMIDIKSFRQAWSYDRADALALLGTAFGVLLFGLQWGIALGVGFSLTTILVRASTPHIAVIGRIPGTEHFRNIERHGTETLPGVLFLRIDESLFFGNLAPVEERLNGELEKAPNTHDLVLIMSAVNRVDTTAMEALNDINTDFRSRGIRLHLAEVKGPVQDRLVNSPLWKSLSGAVFLSVNAAFQSLSQDKKPSQP